MCVCESFVSSSIQYIVCIQHISNNNIQRTHWDSTAVCCTQSCCCFCCYLLVMCTLVAKRHAKSKKKRVRCRQQHTKACNVAFKCNVPKRTITFAFHQSSPSTCFLLCRFMFAPHKHAHTQSIDVKAMCALRLSPSLSLSFNSTSQYLDITFKLPLT